MSILDRFEYYAARGLAFLLARIPRRPRAAFGAAIGQLIHFLGIRTRVTHENIAAAFPGMPPEGVLETTARVYRHFGRVAASLVSIPRLGPKDLGRWIYVDSLDVLQQAVNEGKGGIVFSGHLGNWEIMGAISARCGLPVSFVVASQSNSRIEEFIDRYRMSAGIEIIKRRDATRGVLSALKRNRLVALLIDQDAHEDGAFVPFFGRSASTPRGPAVFHLRTQAPLIFAHSVRLPGERYHITLRRFDTQGLTDADQITALMTARLEAAIRKTPEQWLWMHRRWKTRPAVS